MDFILNEKLGSSIYADCYSANLPAQSDELYRVKLIKPQFADTGMKHYLHQQLSYMQHTGIFDDTLPELLEANNRLALKHPFVTAATLSETLTTNNTLTLAATLHLGIALCDCLERRHKKSWVHGGIKPNNILYSIETGKVSLLDDLTVVTANQLGHLIADETYCLTSLAYQSPEQCGRLRLDVDYRSDLYSLGCVLYHCLAGYSPFTEPAAQLQSAEDIIYSHLAEIPQPLDKQQPECPPSLSHIIAALLEKETEKRYQSAAGLKQDLLVCLEKLAAKDDSPFDLKRGAFKSAIILPSLLLGRDYEIERLQKFYQQVCCGVLGIAYVTGLSGIGKSRLVQELEVPILLHQGLFVSGKYNQFSKHQPYATIAQAIGKLVHFILTETETRLQTWRREILNVVGINGQLLIAVIPELTLLIGYQPKVNPLPPIEARKRFNDLFCRFMKCLATEEHPLVLFIDDLQWCDDATLDVLDQLFAQPQCHPYLLLILAFRSNEVDDDHRVRLAQQSLDKSSAHLLNLHLSELNKATVNEMTAYILSSLPDDIRGITDAIYPTSGGNPLLVSESLRWLHQHQGIFYDSKGQWQCDKTTLDTLQLPAGHLTLFKDKLSRLTPASREVLASAALLGARFKIDTLAALLDVTPGTLMTRLSEAFAEHIVISEKHELYFSHDQIQMAAATLHSPDRVVASHKKIAQGLIRQFKEKQSNSNDSERGQHLYAITEHLKKSRDAQACNEEKIAEANFNLSAGEAALNSLAHRTADYYFAEAISLSTKKDWARHYDFMLALYKNYARSALLMGEQVRSNDIINIAMQQARNDLDRAGCLLAQVVATTSLGHIEQGIALGLSCSQLLQNPLPELEDAIDAELAQHTPILQDPNSLKRYRILSLASDEKVLIELALYGELLASYYVSGRTKLFFLASMRSIVLALQYGKSDATTFAFSVVGTYFHLQQAYPLAQQYEKAWMEEVDLSPYDFGSIRATTQALWLSMHHSHSYTELTKLCRSNIERGIRAGEINYTGLSYMPLIWLKLAKWHDLDDFRHLIQEGLAYCQQYSVSQPLEISRAIEAAMQPFWGELPLNYHRELEHKIKYWQEGEHLAALCNFYFIRARLAYHRGDFARAEADLLRAESFLPAVPGTIIERLWYVYRYLTGLQRGNNPESSEQMHLLSSWAADGPILKPYVELMKAETIANQSDNTTDFRAVYWQAIDSAHNQGYTFLEAYAYERLGVMLDRQKHDNNLLYINEALRLYSKCKATLCAALLNKRFYLASSDTEAEMRTLRSDTCTDVQREQRLDNDFILTAIKGIMQEKDYGALLLKILSAMMARVGAKNSYLIIVTDDCFTICAHGRKNTTVKMSQLKQPMNGAENLCPEICRFAVRTQMPVILANACESEIYGAATTVQTFQLKSVLALPLIAEGRTLGLIYLENALIPNVFSEQEVERLQILTAQAAIALDNNLLISDLNQAQLTLRQSEITLQAEQALLAAMLNNLAEAVILLEHNGLIHRLNRAASQIFGYREEEVAGQSISILLQEDDPTYCDGSAYFQRLVHISSGEGVDVTAKKKNGKTFPLHLSIAELPSMSNRKKRFVASGQDLTNKERQQEKLQRSKKMEALGKLTGGIAHDYNNMLGVILGFSEILEPIAAQDPKGKNYLQQIQKAAERGAVLTDKLLAFSRQKLSTPSATNINDILLSQHNTLQQKLTANIHLQLDLEDNIPLIIVDPHDLDNTILNLCINAMHAMPNGGRLVIKTQYKVIDDEYGKPLPAANRETVVINFSDTGVGMDKDTQSKVFDPFFSTKGENGTGLGLSQAFGFMERSQGTINVDSKPGKGACFSLNFPVSRSFKLNPFKEKTPEIDESLKGSASILVVDDEPALIHLIKEALQKYGYRTYCAESATAAVDIIKSQTIDLVLSDILMPETNGYQLAKDIQQHNPNIIIQLMTGYDDDDSLDASSQLLRSSQLSKPIKTLTLLRRLKELLPEAQPISN